MYEYKGIAHICNKRYKEVYYDVESMRKAVKDNREVPLLEDFGGRKIGSAKLRMSKNKVLVTIKSRKYIGDTVPVGFKLEGKVLGKKRKRLNDIRILSLSSLTHKKVNKNHKVSLVEKNE